MTEYLQTQKGCIVLRKKEFSDSHMGQWLVLPKRWNLGMIVRGSLEHCWELRYSGLRCAFTNPNVLG